MVYSFKTLIPDKNRRDKKVNGFYLVDYSLDGIAKNLFVVFTFKNAINL